MVFLFSLMAFMLPKKDRITIWLIGDSTMSVKEPKAYPETGWGVPFVFFWDSTIRIENRARNGRSSKSFFAEGLWNPVVQNLNKGDYVFIQFGHNDESKEKGDRYSTPEEFKTNLRKYITETRAKEATPVLLTPVGRRKFGTDGRVKETHGEYAPIVKEVATAEKVWLIDLNELSKALYQEFGAESSKFLFNYLKPGEHPNYADGKEDDTHFNELGARKIAGIILAEIRKSDDVLKSRILVPVVKK